MRGEWQPACMDQDEAADWRRHNARLTIGRAKRPCADCLLGYAAEMRSIGRCNGTPMGDPDHDEEEATMDTIPQAKAPVTTPTRIGVEAPCRSCIHAPVCRLRDKVIDAGTISIPVPVLGDGVSIVLTGTVECDWYAKERVARADPKPRREMTEEQREAARQRMLHARAIGVAKKAAEAA